MVFHWSGKTEAYLALAAFEIALRRVRYREAGAGTAVLMRYTLRLLTAQQFERAATLVCVLESMRRNNQAWTRRKDHSPRSLGRGATTPNALDRDNDSAPGARQLLTGIG